MTVSQTAMRRRARIMRAINVPMRPALSLPFATPLSANLMLISYTGRKSGKTYRQPVSYVRDGGFPPPRWWSLDPQSGPAAASRDPAARPRPVGPARTSHRPRRT